MRGIIAAALLFGCASPPPPPPSPAPPPVVHVDPPTAPIIRQPPATKSPFRMVPQELEMAAEQTRIDAATHVASRTSLPADNDRITVLTTRMLSAVRRMGPGPRYRQPDVRAAQQAIVDLRGFLSHKELSAP